MSFQEPTYEEYKVATVFARIRYKYGLVITILCWLCLLFIIYYMVTNGKALAENPLIYGAEKYDVECICRPIGEISSSFIVNSTSISVLNDLG